MSKNIYRYENLSTVDLAELPRDKTVVFLPCSPLEEHGPHLPFGVDAFMAEFFSNQVAQRLADSRCEWHFVLMPTLFAGCDTLSYAGTIEIPQYIIRDILYSTAKKLAKDGFRYLITVGGHGGPRHVVALEEVAAKISWRFRHTKMISASGRILAQILGHRFGEKVATYLEKRGTPLTGEEKNAFHNDYHGGLVETSLMMVAKPDLVKPQYKKLKPAIIKSAYKIRHNSGQKIGEGLGYLGSPAFAKKEIGEAIIDILISEMIPQVESFLSGDKKIYKKFRSRFYYIPFFRTHFRYLVVMLLSFTLFMGMTAYFLRLMAKLAQQM